MYLLRKCGFFCIWCVSNNSFYLSLLHTPLLHGPSLPRRADTFGGFDQPQPPQLKPHVPQEEQPAQPANSAPPPAESSNPGEMWKGLPSVPPLLQLDPEQQEAAVHMTHYLNSLMCMVSEHFTSLERYKNDLIVAVFLDFYVIFMFQFESRSLRNSRKIYDDGRKVQAESTAGRT